MIHFAQDLPGSVGIFGEDEQEDPAALDGVDDGFPVGRAGQDIPGRDPAAQAPLLQPGDHGLGGVLIFCGIADKYLVIHKFK